MEQNAVRSIRPVLIGIFFTILLLLGLAYLADQRRNATARAPQLTIIEPTHGASIDSPLVLVFASAAPLALLPTGWGASNLHLHARINGQEVMPAAADIRREGDRYFWTIPGARRGPVEIRLGWADQAHRELSTGASDTMSAVLR